ncbi:MAG: response regulator, partial [Paracoccaceae bacterium]
PQGQITDPLCPHAAHRPLMPAALMARLTRVMQTPLAAPRRAAADAHTDAHTDVPPEAAPVVASDTSLDIPQAPPSEHLTEVAAKAPRDDTGDAAPAPPPPTLAPEESLESLRVLVVDDNELNRIVTKSFLDRSRATVALAESGAQALELAAQNTFDVVLMDIQMPDMDGYETTQRLRALGYDMPVLAVTSNAMQHDIDRSAAEGLQAHLTKPLSRGKLVAELRPYVGATKSPARVAKTRAAHTPHATSATIPPIPAGMPQPPAGLPQTLRSLGVNLDRGLRLHGDAWPAYTAALTEFAHTTAHLPDTLHLIIYEKGTLPRHGG